MTIEVGILVAVVGVVVSVAAFFIARLKDAEERGALKQRVADLEKRADATDAKFDVVLKKLDEIAAKLGTLVTEHRIRGDGRSCFEHEGIEG